LEIRQAELPGVPKEANDDSQRQNRQHPGSQSGRGLKFSTQKLGFKVVTDQPFDGKQRWIELLIPGAETWLALFTPEGHENRIGDFSP